MSKGRAHFRVKVMVAAVWTLSALFSLPQIFIFSVLRGPFAVDFYQCVTFRFYTRKWQETLYSSASALLLFIMPLLAMVGCYGCIFFVIARKSSEIARESTVHRRPANPRGIFFNRAKSRSIRLTAVIVAAFVICWSPYHVILMLQGLYSKDVLNTDVAQWIFFFGMANSMINPLIYGAFHICPQRYRNSQRRLPQRNNHQASGIQMNPMQVNASPGTFATYIVKNVDAHADEDSSSRKSTSQRTASFRRSPCTRISGRSSSAEERSDQSARSRLGHGRLHTPRPSANSVVVGNSTDNCTANCTTNNR